METYGSIPNYHDQNLPGPDLQQGLPHILAGVPGLCRVGDILNGFLRRWL